MPSSSHSSSSKTTSSRRSSSRNSTASSRRSTSQSTAPQEKATPRKPSKFIPNIVQLQEALAGLPDPELWDAKHCTSPITVNGDKKQIEFVRKRVERGSSQPYRWIYEGKVLIRKQDASGQ